MLRWKVLESPKKRSGNNQRMWWAENLALEGIRGKILLTLLSSAGPHPKSGHKLLSKQKAENSPLLTWNQSQEIDWWKERTQEKYAHTFQEISIIRLLSLEDRAPKGCCEISGSSLMTLSTYYEVEGWRINTNHESMVMWNLEW